jgi:NADPH-dependent ferric siderophore reductase
MNMSDSTQSMQRRPPRLRRLFLAGTDLLTPHMVRATVAGPELEGFEVPEPAGSIRLLVPSTGTSDLVMPEWNGNEFLLPDGERPIIRTFTPRHFEADGLALDIDIVLHPDGATSGWATAARPGDPVAVTGPGRGYRIDADAPSFFLAGDETALPAISQLLEEIPAAKPVQVIIEVAHPAARLELPDHPGANVVWTDRAAGDPPGEALVEAVRDAAIELGTKVWVAGEAGSLFHIRRNLMEDRRLPRADVTVRGYWKHGR